MFIVQEWPDPNVESVRLELQKWDYLLTEVLDRDLWYFVNTTGKCLRNEWWEKGWQLHGSVAEEPNGTLIVSTGLRWHVLAWHFLGTAAAVVPSLSLFLFKIFSSQLFSPLLSGCGARPSKGWVLVQLSHSRESFFKDKESGWVFKRPWQWECKKRLWERLMKLNKIWNASE